MAHHRPTCLSISLPAVNALVTEDDEPVDNFFRKNNNAS